MPGARGTPRLRARPRRVTLSRATSRAFYGARSGLREAQELAVEPILAGDDVLVIAGTGSGKTEAVVAPLVDRHLESALSAEGLVTYVYVSPTKALANDMAARLERPLAELHLDVGRKHGDRDDLSKKRVPQFLIITPESLDIQIVARQPRLLGVKAVILDEVHQVAGTQRGLQLCLVLLRLEAWLGREVQATGMSATLADPASAWAQVRPGRPCTVIQTDARRERAFVLRRAESDGAVSDLLAKTSAKGKVLVFARSRGETEAIAANVGEGTGFGRRVYVHHSSLDVDVREQVERDLKGRDATLCVATSTLELGIDIGDINLVVLVGPPPDWRSLEQRIGRTNRRGDRTDVLGVIAPSSKLPVLDMAYFLGLIAQANGELQREEIPSQQYGAVAQQAVSMLRQSGDWLHRRDLAAVLARAPGVSTEDVDDILDALVSADVFVNHPIRNMVGSGPGIEQIVDSGDAWSNFPASSQVVHLFDGNRRIGEVPMSPHNARLLQPGRLLAFKGRVMEVERLVRGREVHLRPTTGKPQDKLTFGGNAGTRDPYLVQQLPLVLADRGHDRHLSTSAREWWSASSTHLTDAIDAGGVPCWRGSEGVAHATFSGLWINRVLLSLQGDHGRADEVVVHLPNRLVLADLPDFETLDAAAVKCSPRLAGLTSWQKLLPVPLLEREVLSTWHGDPVYRRAWTRLQASTCSLSHDDRLSALG